MTKFKTLLKDTKAATAIEYGLIAALIAVAGITAMTSVGKGVGKTFNNVNAKL
jgi:pilus assembly protein Flp/PilA